MDKTSSDPSVLAFALKLAGLLAASKEGFTRLQVELVILYTHYSFTKSKLFNQTIIPYMQECSLLDSAFSYQHWQEAGVWEDPCLRIGWIHGLKNLLKHPKALAFFEKSGD